MSNLGFINSQLNLQPNTPPPSMSVGNVGFTRSPFSQDVGALTRFLSNRVVKPVTNYTTNKINPIIDDVSQYFGYGNVSPNVIPKVPTVNISGKQIFSNIQDTGSNLINKVGGVLVPSANEGEDKLINNINSGLLTNEQIVNQNKGTGQSLLDTNQQVINKNKEFFSGQSLTDVNNNTSSNTYDSQTSNNTTTNNTTTADNQTVGKNTNNETVTTEQKQKSQTLGVESQDPNAEVVATPNGEGTPTNKFMDKFVNFAESEFGKDFFASLAEKSGPKVLKPQSFGSNFGSAYKDAREKQLEREKITGENSQDGTYRGTIDSEKGTTHMVFTDKGKSYVNIDGKRVYEKDFGNVLGKNYSYRTMGQQSLGILGSKPFGDLSQDLNNDEVSLNLYIEYLDNIGDSSKGLKRMGDIFSARIKNILGEDPSQEQLATLLASADLPGIVGRSRLEIAGPGVMTDKDFLFILENLGGNVNSLQNPLVVQEQISKLFANKYKNFETKRKIYNANVNEEYKKYGYEKINPLEFSDRQLKLLSINTLVKNNLTNLETYDTASLQDIINSANANPETIDKALEVLESRNLDD
jgi:hypothetical protein